MTLTLDHVARVAYEARVAYLRTQGDASAPDWDHITTDDYAETKDGIRFRLEHPGSSPRGQHEAWLKAKIADGWVHGAERDPVAKLHPLIREYRDIPASVRTRIALFCAVVDALVGEHAESLLRSHHAGHESPASPAPGVYRLAPRSHVAVGRVALTAKPRAHADDYLTGRDLDLTLDGKAVDFGYMTALRLRCEGRDEPVELEIVAALKPETASAA